MAKSLVYLTRRITFCASHRLHSQELSEQQNQEVFDKCNNLNGHGHNYILFVTIKGIPDPITGMIMNLVELKNILDKEIIEKFDHKHLNKDTKEFQELNPTAENMVIVFWKLLIKKLPTEMLHEVKLYETENNIAIYKGE